MLRCRETENSPMAFVWRNRVPMFGLAKTAVRRQVPESKEVRPGFPVDSQEGICYVIVNSRKIWISAKLSMMLNGSGGANGGRERST